MYTIIPEVRSEAELDYLLDISPTSPLVLKGEAKNAKFGLDFQRDIQFTSGTLALSVCGCDLRCIV